MKNNKKNILKLLIAIALTVPFGVILSGCGTIKRYAWDSMLTPEESATIVTQNMHTITGYNGNDVSWNKPDKVNATIITVPPGSTELLFDATYTESGGIFTAKDIALKFNFEAGKKYYMKFSREIVEKGESGGGWGVYIYSSHWARKDQIIEFIPLNIKWGVAPI